MTKLRVGLASLVVCLLAVMALAVNPASASTTATKLATATASATPSTAETAGTTTTITTDAPAVTDRTTMVQASTASVKVTASSVGGVSSISWYWCCPPHFTMFFNPAGTKAISDTFSYSLLSWVSLACSVMGGSFGVAACIGGWPALKYYADRAYYHSPRQCLKVSWLPGTTYLYGFGSYGPNFSSCCYICGLHFWSPTSGTTKQTSRSVTLTT